MGLRVVFVRPKFDEATSYSYLWCERLINQIKGKLEDYVDLAGENATRENVEKTLREKPDYDFCFYNHGDQTGLLAQNGKEYAIDKKNDVLLKGRVAYSMACLSSDTEILTKEGWKGIGEINANTEILTFDNNRDRLVFQKPLAYIEKDWNGKMIHFKGRGVDILVTPDHRMLYEYYTKSGRKRKVAEAQKIRKSGQIYIPVAFKAELRNSLPYPDEFISLLGWIITEGKYHKSNIEISQSPKNVEAIKEIKCLLDSLGFKYTYTVERRRPNNLSKRPYKIGVFRISSEDSKRIKEVIPNKTLTREILTNASRRQLKLLYEAMMKGDGTIRMDRKRRRGTFYTSDANLANMFQELVTLLGYASTLSKFRNLYYVSVTENKSWRFIKKGGKEVPYKGKVWCVTVPNGFIVTRRNGKVAIVGNCSWGSDGAVDAYRKGAKVVVAYVKVFSFTTNEEHLFCRAANSGFIAYANGETDWRRIKQIMIEEFNRAIDEASDPWTKVWLRWDRDALRIYAEGVDTPESNCFFRKIAIKLFGPKVGWKITRTQALGWISYLVGYGISLHDFSHQVYQLKGTVLSLEGGYIGFAFLLAGFILLVSDHVKWLKH